ncbi:MAG: hypothetical protein Q6370_000070 [Candidatus Sigynarchaeota archaeon]
MPGIYYRVQHVRVPGMPVPRPAAITRPSKPIATEQPAFPPTRSRASCSAITTTRPPAPVLVHPRCAKAREIVAGLVAAGIAAKTDSSIPGEVALPGGIGVRVINQNDADGYDAAIAMEELPGTARRAVIVSPEAGAAVAPGVLARLATELVPAGIDVSRCDTHEAIVEKIVSMMPAK